VWTELAIQTTSDVIQLDPTESLTIS